LTVERDGPVLQARRVECRLQREAEKPEIRRVWKRVVAARTGEVVQLPSAQVTLNQLYPD
jgi:hypothetical protein